MINKFRKRMFSLFKCTVYVCCFVLSFNKLVLASTSSIIIDANSGEVLSSSAADTLRYPASLTKLMTLYITFDALDKGILRLSDKIPVSRNAANKAPSKIGVRAGEKIKVETAVLAVVVKSANDCAAVLAEGLGYTEDNFAKTMTKVAHELGMKNTTFKNASGLPHKEQKTTARDMAILGAAMYHHFPKYYKLFATKSFSYEGRTYYTHNHILKNFAGADGMKTGFTNAAGYNIVTSAERNGKRVIAVTMGHDTAKLRDKKVSTLMSQGLTKLALNDKINNSNMYAELYRAEEPNLASIPSEEKVISSTEQEEIVSDVWGIQVGAFSNYAKARNYALKINKEIKKRFSDKVVDIEPYQTGAAIIYRSKIIGFAKNDADETCNRLKRANKSCIVVATIQKPELIVAHNKY